MNIENNSQSVALKTGVDRLDDDNQIKIGNWYALNLSDESLFYAICGSGRENEIKPDSSSVLVCADRFESNLVILKSNACEYRVLNKNMDRLLKPVNDIDSLVMVEDALANKRVTINQLQQQIKSIIQKLNPNNGSESDSTEVMVATKDALVAKTTELKNVHGNQIDNIGKEIQSHVGDLTYIAKYITLPASVNMNQISEGKSIIDEKVHELAIYGGLYEQENIVSEGYSARDDEPIHIYQNLKFMDVECIDAYVTGGINANNIPRFDKWLAEPENRDRVLPQPKSIVAIKNRKYPKRSGWSNEPNDTYLYIRNGDNIKRLKTAIDIQKTLLATDNPMGAESYVKIGRHRKKDFIFITEGEYQQRQKHIKLFKPLFISSALESYRVEKKYLESLLRYANGRKNAKARIMNNNAEPQELDQKSDEDHQDHIAAFEQHTTKNQIKINELQGLVEKILSSNKIDSDEIHTDIKHASDSWIPVSSYTECLGISEDEIGYIDESGEEVALPIKTKDYREELNKIKREYRDIVLEHEVSSSRDFYDPFEKESELLKYKLINDDHFFFDDIKKIQWKNYKRQNELAVLIQGIIDRTSFFGYIQANLFKSGFEETIKLVYDEKTGIYNGPIPDFKSFIAECNEKTAVGDVFYGQSKVWADLESEKRESYRDSGHNYHYECIHMPEFLEAAKIVKKRNGKTVAVFKWKTPRDFWSQAKSKYKNHTFECDIDKLINVSQYNKGDYKQFANDPRCRALYPQWGALIMATEYYKRENAQK